MAHIIDTEATDATGQTPDSTNPTRPYPIEREVAEYISKHEPGWSISHVDLAERIGINVNHRDFSLKVLRVRKYLLDEGIVLWADRGESTYRILTEEEKVTHEAPRLQRRMIATVHHHREVLASVDSAKLSPDAKAQMERHRILNGFMATAYQASKREDLKAPDALRRMLEAGDEDDEIEAEASETEPGKDAA